MKIDENTTSHQTLSSLATGVKMVAMLHAFMLAWSNQETTAYLDEGKVTDNLVG